MSLLWNRMAPEMALHGNPDNYQPHLGEMEQERAQGIGGAVTHPLVEHTF